MTGTKPLAHLPPPVGDAAVPEREHQERREEHHSLFQEKLSIRLF